jgi:hypothetical protein
VEHLPSEQVPPPSNSSVHGRLSQKKFPSIRPLLRSEATTHNTRKESNFGDVQLERAEVPQRIVAAKRIVRRQSILLASKTEAHFHRSGLSSNLHKYD